MYKSIALIFLIVLTESSAQVKEYVNLVRNGDFEDGFSHFTSDYIYKNDKLASGEITVTSKAYQVNSDCKNPKNGDHTSGQGKFLLVNADGYADQKIWCTTVEVVPNSEYNFSAYFCNLFEHVNSNKGFIINGLDLAQANSRPCKIQMYVNKTSLGEPETDIYHLFDWVKINRTWYSDTLKGKIKIWIQNVNYDIYGNDLALDDIEFFYTRTMPKGYKPPLKNTVMILPNGGLIVDNTLKFVKGRKSTKFNEIALGDSIAPGVYSLYKKSTPKDKQIKDSIKIGLRITLSKVTFEQGNALLRENTKTELDKLTIWLKENQNVKIRLEGHTDNQGDPYLNLALSEERVKNVKDYLVLKGIDGTRITFKGYGGTRPIANNSAEETRKLNRRVEFEIVE